MGKQILKFISGAAASIAIAFSVGVPAAAAYGNAWMGVANGGTVIYNTNQWYTSSTINPWSQNLPGTINDISIQATVTSFPSFASGIQGRLCAERGVNDDCRSINDVIDGTTINGTTDIFEGASPSTSFYFQWRIQDSFSRPIPSTTVIARQTINVFYE